VSASLALERWSAPPYQAGLQGAFSGRRGAFAFPALDARIDTLRADAMLAGFFLGRRIPLASAVRLQLTGGALYGHAPQGQLTLQNGDSYDIRHYFRKLAVELEAHVLLPPLERAQLYVRLGAAALHTLFSERFFQTHNPDQEVIIGSDDFAYRAAHWSPAGLAGAGVDLRIQKDVGVGINYGFRLSRPVSFTDTRNMPLGIDYREVHVSHVLRILFQFAIESL
jgi:hypothetical protein